MNKIKILLRLIIIFFLSSCSNENKTNSKEDSNSSFYNANVKVNIYDKKYYQICPGDSKINKTTMLFEDVRYYYFYKNICTYWCNSKYLPVISPESKFSLRMMYFKLIDNRVFLSDVDINGYYEFYADSFEDLTDSLVEDFYKLCPLKDVKEFLYTFEASDKTLIYKDFRSTVVYATQDYAEKLGITFIE